MAVLTNGIIFLVGPTKHTQYTLQLFVATRLGTESCHSVWSHFLQFKENCVFVVIAYCPTYCTCVL